MDLSKAFMDQVDDSVNNATSSSNFHLDLPTMLDLEFSNLPLDYLNGVLPNQQYEDMTVAPLTGISSTVDRIRAISGSDLTTSQPIESASSGSSVGIRLGGTSMKYVELYDSDSNGTGGLRLDSLRRAIALQRYKEIQMSSDSTYADLIEKHFGVRPKDIPPFDSSYIGGFDDVLDVNPQVNQNLAGDNAATYGSAPVGTGSGSISYTCTDEPVIIMGMYTAIPQMDYENVGIDRRLLLTDATDFPIPEMDSIGLQSTYLAEIYVPNESVSVLDGVNIRNTYGYAPRYAEWKTARDIVSGAFNTKQYRTWTNPFPKDYLSSIFLRLGGNGVSTYDYFEPINFPMSIPHFLFKNSPWWLSRIFVNERMLSVDDDKFLVGAFFKVDVTRRLSKYGLPYAS